jgi:hypothetical protein
VQADVMHLDGRAIMRRCSHRHLELARQEAELGVQRRPLPDDLGVGARVGHLLRGGAGEVVGGDVTDAVAGGLDGVHLDLGEFRQDIGDIAERRPVELQVLARGEVAIAAVIDAGDVGELAHLPRGQRAVRDRNAQHVGVQLQIEAVHQPQRLEFVLGQLAADAAPDLVAELRHALAHELRVEFVVAVHESGGLGMRVFHAPFDGLRAELSLRPALSGLVVSLSNHGCCLDVTRDVAEDAGAAQADTLAEAHRRQAAVGGLVHLDEIGLDHDVAGGIEGAARLQRADLIGRARNHGAAQAFHPHAVEIEEHDGAVGQTVGGQDRDAGCGLAHEVTSAVCAAMAWREALRARR